MPRAARVGDEISHTSAFQGLVVGAVAGAVAGALIGVAVIATAGTAVVAIGAAACTGASLGGVIGELIGAERQTPAGAILTGASSVMIGGSPAARAVADVMGCSEHASAPIAQGSATVIIEGFPAARAGDRGICGAIISGGCGAVIIGGGETSTYLEVRSEVPWQAEATLLLLGLIGPGGLMRLAGMGWAAISARLAAGMVTGYAGSMGGQWLGGELFGQGSMGQKLSALGGGFLGAAIPGMGLVNRLSIATRLRRSAEMIRSFYLKKPYPKSNVAVAEVYMSDGSVFGTSSTSKAAGLAPKPLPRSKGGEFEPTRDPVVGRVMDTDAEYKVLSAVANTLDEMSAGGGPQVTRVYLFSERAPCSSCWGVIKQFEKKYGVKVDVLYNLNYPP